MEDNRRGGSDRKRPRISRSSNSERTSFGGNRPRRSFGEGSERKSFDGERKSFDREKKSFDGERKPFDREKKSFGGERKSFNKDGGSFKRNDSRSSGFKSQRPEKNTGAVRLDNRIEIALQTLIDVEKNGKYINLAFKSNDKLESLDKKDRAYHCS